MKRCFVFLVALCFSTAMAFAGGGGQSSGASGGLTTIKMTHQSSMSAGIPSGYYWIETLAKDLGIQLDLVPSSPDNMKTMIAARDLPEFITTSIPTAMKMWGFPKRESNPEPESYARDRNENT